MHPCFVKLLLYAKAAYEWHGRVDFSSHSYLPWLQKEMADHMTRMRSVCISQVLGTDMKKHFQILSSFQVLTESPVTVHHLCLKADALCGEF